MLLLINIQRGPAAQGRPVLRGRQGEGPRAGPHASTSCWRSARPIATSSEYERAYLIVWRGLDRGQLPRGRPRRRAAPPARQDARGDGLPARPLAIVSQHGLDRERLLRPLAGPRPGGVDQAFTDPTLRRELAAAGITRSELLLQSIRMIQVFLVAVAQEPDGRRGQPGAGRRVPRARGLRGRRQALPPGSPSSIPRARSSTASSTARRWATSTSASTTAPSRSPRRSPGPPTRTPAGADQPSPNKWQALYILGQIYDARRQPARALEYYKQVADRFTDAAGAIKSLHAQGPEGARGHGGPARATAGRRRQRPAGFRAVARPRPRAAPSRRKPGSPLDYRNIAEVDVKVYPVDLMQLYLTRRNLDGIAGIDLAGITPLVEKTVTLGDGADLRRQGQKRSTCP